VTAARDEETGHFGDDTHTVISSAAEGETQWGVRDENDLFRVFG
jgi:hypothetical protein